LVGWVRAKGEKSLRGSLAWIRVCVSCGERHLCPVLQPRKSSHGTYNLPVVWCALRGGVREYVHTSHTCALLQERTGPALTGHIRGGHGRHGVKMTMKSSLDSHEPGMYCACCADGSRICSRRKSRERSSVCLALSCIVLHCAANATFERECLGTAW
jgi:hypothetical protein